MSGDGNIWFFAYGSLMWRPGFPYLEMRPALVRGYHRALCLYSIVYRGTPEKPGLVMGLDRGGACRGRAYRVAKEDALATLNMLDARELVHNAYQRKLMKIRLDGGNPIDTVKATVDAYVYIAMRGHRQYAGGLSEEQAVEAVLQGHGKEGSSLDYLRNTVEHLDDLGIDDGPLHALLEKVEGGK